MRLIDADALEERMEERLAQLRALYGDHDQYKEGFEGGMKSVEFAPALTLDDIRPHGRWIKKGPRCVCGECKQGIKANLPSMDIWLDLSTLPFCPNCGAKMDKEEDNETD